MLKASEKNSKNSVKPSKDAVNAPISVEIDQLNNTIKKAKAAQAIYATFTQEQVDKIFNNR